MTASLRFHYRLVLLSLATCGALLGCSSDSSTTPTTPPPTPVPPLVNRIIVAGKNPNCTCFAGIWTSDTAGGDLKPLITGLGWPEYISVSPDGRTVLFENWGALDLADANGANVRSLETGDQVTSYAPTWSPDGQWIVFQWADIAGPHAPVAFLYQMHPDGSGRRRVTGAQGRYEYQPTFSRDGTRLAFIAANPTTGSRSVVVRDLLTGHEQVISDTGFTGQDPAWSPDGSSLLFLDGTSGWALWRLDVGTHAYSYFANSEGNRAPKFSPDGRSLVFGTGDLWVSDASGQHPRQLVSDSIEFFGANWTPAAAP